MAEPDALAAALHRLAEHAERLATLDVHDRTGSDRITTLATQAAAMQETLAAQADILAGLAGPGGQIAQLTARFDEIAPSGDDAGGATYRPAAPARFWRLAGPAREQAIIRLRAWVEQIYRPSYGQHAAALGDCWEQHPLCLYTLDWLSELWSVLYLQPIRTTSSLVGQAEWQTRLLPAAADQMTRETSRCRHASVGNGRAAR